MSDDDSVENLHERAELLALRHHHLMSVDQIRRAIRAREDGMDPVQAERLVMGGRSRDQLKPARPGSTGFTGSAPRVATGVPIEGRTTWVARPRWFDSKTRT